MRKNTLQSFFTTIPGSILIGSIIISLSILIGNGVIKIKGINPTSSASLITTAQAPTQPNQQAPSAPAAKTDINLGHLPPKGSNSAKVAVVEFGDLRCPFCDRFFKDTEPQLLKDYVDTGKVKFVFRQFEFLGAASTTAGNATECANEQGKFWEMHDYLYQNQPEESDTSMYNSDKLTSIATNLGLDGNQFKSCLDSTKYAKNVADDLSEGQSDGVTGTPTFYIGKLDSSGTKITGAQQLVGAQPYSALKTIIDQQLSQ